jgi:hypothetical protein
MGTHRLIAAPEKIDSARRRNQHASHVRYPDSGRYTPKIDKGA